MSEREPAPGCIPQGPVTSLPILDTEKDMPTLPNRATRSPYIAPVRRRDYPGEPPTLRFLASRLRSRGVRIDHRQAAAVGEAWLAQFDDYTAALGALVILGHLAGNLDEVLAQ